MGFRGNFIIILAVELWVDSFVSDHLITDFPSPTIPNSWAPTFALTVGSLGSPFPPRSHQYEVRESESEGDRDHFTYASQG